MFNYLLESSPHRQKKAGSTVFSIGIHSALIAGAAWATAHSAIKNEKPKIEKVTYVEVKKDEPPPPKQPLPPPPKDVTVTPPPPKGFQVLKAPVIIPTVIPNVDLSKRVTDAADYSGKGVAGGVAKGVEGGTGPIGSDATTYYAYQVERTAKLDPDSPKPPPYPETLRGAGIEGQVDAQFVVDTNGRAEVGSFKVTQTTNQLFSQKVQETLPRMRFFSAEVGGRKVRELVQQSFSFSLH